MLSVAARVKKKERSCKNVIVPPHPAPPPPRLETMPCRV